MSALHSPKVAVLGLGIIGSRALGRLQEAGIPSTCWSRSPRGWAGHCATPEAAIDGAGLVSLYLKDSPAVREVVERLEVHLVAGQTLLNHSTVDLTTTHWLAERCAARGCRFLDAPFTGSRIAAEQGQLVYYTGGDAALAAELDSYLAATSRLRLHCGDVGAATVVKLATNLISACSVQAMAEALAIATRHGVGPDQLIEAVALNASGSALAAMKMPAMAEGSYDAHFSLSNMAKDTRYMLELAAAGGLDTPAIAAVSRRMEELCEHGLDALDYSAVAHPYLQQP